MEAIEFGTSAIDGVIEIPPEYRKDFSTGLRVILIKDVSRSTNLKQQDADIQERLAAAKRLVGIATRNPLSLEEIRNERLARQ
jgi:aminoglycoside/choline kinase family phosphotransferase